MLFTTTAQGQSDAPTDWSTSYATLLEEGNVPDADGALINAQAAVFRGMYQDLGAIQASIGAAALPGGPPPVTTVYADVLVVPTLSWELQTAALVIYARRLELTGGAQVVLNCQSDESARVLVFASEVAGPGTLAVAVVPPAPEQSPPFRLTPDNVSPGVMVYGSQGGLATQVMPLSAGLEDGRPPTALQLHLATSFSCATLLYDQQPTLALALLRWVNVWTAQSDQLAELFYRSTSLATLLSAEQTAAASGAAFVPYLTASVYADLTRTLAAEAASYETQYAQLSTQRVFTDEEIAAVKTMVGNTQSEVAYVGALLQQAKANCDNAQAAAANAKLNFKAQQQVVENVGIDFKLIGLPDYEKDETVGALFTLVQAVVSFGAGIAGVAAGDGAATPAAAENAISSVENLATAANTGAEVASTANTLAAAMGKLKNLLETLAKLGELAQTVKEVADNLSTAGNHMQEVQALQDAANAVDPNAADGWAVYKLQADSVLQGPIDKNIEYALDYREALDVLVVYGQSLLAAQLAVVQTGQQAAALLFQQHYAQQKQASLQQLANALAVGQAPTLGLMQQLYQKSLDSKSALFVVLKAYQAAYFYWALSPSQEQPRLVESVSVLNSGIGVLSSQMLDNVTGLAHFKPLPQQMDDLNFEISDPATLDQLNKTGQATWVLPLDSSVFADLDRVRVTTVRVWLEGLAFNTDNGSVHLTIMTDGNYFDRYQGTDYQFSSKPLTRLFEYQVATQELNSDWVWRFDDGRYGFLQIDGAVDPELVGDYFQPTPFSEWTISLTATDNPDLDLENLHVSKITMCFIGTAIQSDPARASARAAHA